MTHFYVFSAKEEKQQPTLTCLHQSAVNTHRSAVRLKQLWEKWTGVQWKQLVLHSHVILLICLQAICFLPGVSEAASRCGLRPSRGMSRNLKEWEKSHSARSSNVLQNKLTHRDQTPQSASSNKRPPALRDKEEAPVEVLCCSLPWGRASQQSAVSSPWPRPVVAFWSQGRGDGWAKSVCTAGCGGCGDGDGDGWRMIGCVSSRLGLNL